ncbi:TetR/AcrR family transcriptional regulator [Desulfovibrio sp. JC010]|uniref:TetR/AcrR family transcriptional regulator n=1 Tax=Desulfovibrio sp. JC010 TaxID=2593641 RepID=UPI0013D26E86|nr:TetR/AcrR family transcriptional regulator [Desulfovibrio sp. JC010]NDV27540.1 TetR/AcrR family transcriptional regulator [Desulfovibrio sp. JC010]
MARPKAYDREKVLDAATEIFWRKGYNAASLADLVAATGLNKHSMYKEFGSKAGLFAACLDHYAATAWQKLGKILKREPLGLENIRAFFAERIQYTCSEDYKSCLTLKATVGINLLESNAVERLAVHEKVFKQAFWDCLQAAIDNGELPKGKDPALLTDFLLNNIRGMLVSAELSKDEDRARKIVELVMGTLES